MRLAPAAQRLDQEAGRGARPRRVGEVMRDVGMGLVERRGRRIVAIALLGDGQRDDLHRRIAQRAQQRLRVLGRDQHVLDARR